MKSTQVALSGILAALGLAIPLLFRGFLQIVIPGVGYSATLASHVPVMLAMVGGWPVAAIVGGSSTIGFFLTLGPVVASRAATHIVWGVVGALLLRRGWSLLRALLVVALPLHAFGEGLVVMAFGVPLYGAGINIVGTAIHHLVDTFITLVVMRSAQPFLRRLGLETDE